MMIKEKKGRNKDCEECGKVGYPFCLQCILDMKCFENQQEIYNLEQVVRDEACSLMCEYRGEWFRNNASKKDETDITKQINDYFHLISEIGNLTHKHSEFQKKIINRRKSLYKLTYEG